MNILNKVSTHIIRPIKSLSTCGKLFLFLSVMLILVYIYNEKHETKEGFKQSKKFVLKQGDNVFDDFYVDYYDDLTHDSYKNSFEVTEFL